MKKFFVGALFLLMLLTFTACGSKKEVTPKKEKETIKGNCTVFECIKNIEVTDTVEQVNEKMGFDGSLDKEAESYKIYKWEVTKDSYVEIQFNNGGKSNIKIEFNKEKIADSKLDLSSFDEMRTIVQKGEMTYSKFCEMVGNVEGTLVEKSSFSNKYLWYSASNNYLYGTFSASSNKCTFVSGLRNQQ